MSFVWWVRGAALVALLSGCDGGSDDSAGGGGSTGDEPPGTGSTTGGGSTAGTSSTDGDSTGAEACEPPGIACLDPDDSQLGCSPAVTDTPISFDWTVEGQAPSPQTCTTTFGAALTFECEATTITLTLQAAEPIDTFDWQPEQPVEVSWGGMSILGEADEFFTVRDVQTGELLLEAVDLAWSEPPGDGDPIAVSAVRDVCCGAQDNVGLRFELGEADETVLYANAQAELADAEHTYRLHVGESWFDHCPFPGLDVRVSGFSYLIARQP